ncbi:MAG: FAD-binding protein [Verrucomicrobia bacterium]|nr:FAD-binding protein [Verrucomicrobiota bacterium]
MSDQWDAILIGGGPAGASAAAVLSEHGRKVLVLEREKFPRYHVGESLIPFTYAPLERLGMISKLRQSAFLKKYSVQFVSPSGSASQPFYFFTRYDRETIAQTWQVLRSEFDQLNLDNAREKGATVLEETRVTELLKEGEAVVGVRAELRDGTQREFRAPITLDCSGKEAFSTVRQGWRTKDPYLNKVAVWTYYKGSKREPDIAEGATTVAFVPEKGWFWHIPQHDDMVSVGVVAEGKYLTRGGVKSPKDIFHREVTQNAWIQDHLSTGQQVGDYYLTNEYSFHSKHCGSQGLLLVGDAFAFLDPVFSSGLMLALKSGVMAGDAVHAALAAGDVSPERFTDYANTLREGIENMRKLVYAFYNPNFSFRQVTDKYPHLGADITDCLSGDVNKDFSRLWDAIREWAPIPDDLPIGQPLVSREAAVAAQ